ncbi:MAG: hypothetical protein KC503_43255 [Myxococcales bacterium]|nr:hypothetical protein [Myxococcales bacterium]
MVEAAIKLHLFGGFRVERAGGGGDVSLNNKKGRALLCYLALQPQRRAPRATLATLLWADTGPQRARHNLRQCVAALRRSLGDEALQSDDDALALVAASDVDALAEAIAIAGDGGGEQQREALERVLTIYLGELMGGFFLDVDEFDRWLDDERRRARDRACDALQRLATLHDAAGEHEGAISAIERWLEIDPACEAAHRALMRRYDAAGRRSDALAQYERCVEALARAYEAKPEAETNALYQRLRAASTPEPTTTPAAESAEAATRAVSALPHAPRVTPHAALPVVAVLPLENLSNEDDDYFSDGIAEDLITELTRFRSLIVIARTSSFRLRDEALSIPQIAERLGAHYIVHGSVRRGPQSLRISAQLIDGASGRHLWANRYKVRPDELFELEDELLRTIVATLADRVEAAQLSRARRKSPDALLAHDFVLRGKCHHHRFDEKGADDAREMFERAIETDPQYALAHAWLGCAYGLKMAHARKQQAMQYLALAYQAAQRALALDDDEGECHRILAAINLLTRNFDLAEHHQARAMALNPNDDRILCQMGELSYFLGRGADGVAWVERAMRVNPYHSDRYFLHLSRLHRQTGNHAEAARCAARINAADLQALVASVAACAHAEAALLEPRLAALRARVPTFSAERFVASLPFKHARDAQQLVDALVSAGLQR